MRNIPVRKIPSMQSLAEAHPALCRKKKKAAILPDDVRSVVVHM